MCAKELAEVVEAQPRRLLLGLVARAGLVGGPREAQELAQQHAARDQQPLGGLAERTERLWLKEGDGDKRLVQEAQPQRDHEERDVKRPVDPEEHPDFAWVPYSNPHERANGGSENPYLGYGQLLQVVGDDIERQ